MHALFLSWVKKRLLSESKSNLIETTQNQNQTTNSLAANHLVLVVLAGQDLQRRLDDAASEAEHQVQRRLLLDVVVGQRAPVLELLSGEDEALLVRRDAC